ncbi:hypothetical protein BG011_005123, partial [Mortierella polycephala]
MDTSVIQDQIPDSTSSTAAATASSTSFTPPTQTPFSGLTNGRQQAHARLHTVPESIIDFRLFDGKNSPQNIAVYGFGLGALFGSSVILATVVQTPIPQFWCFLAA